MKHSAIGINNGNWRGGDLKEYIQSLRKANDPLTDREIALEEIRKSLGSEVFENWYREVYRLRQSGTQADYEFQIFKKLEEIKQQPDSLFSEVLILEHRRDVILENFAKSDNQDELTGELAEIQTSLDSYYGRLDDVADARLCVRHGVSL